MAASSQFLDEDVTIKLLDYDWRAACNHPEAWAGSQKAAAPARNYQKPLITVRPPTPTPLPAHEKPPTPTSPNLRRSDLAPGLVPEFFRSHLATPHGTRLVKQELTADLAPSPPTAAVAYAGPCNIVAMGAPLQPRLTPPPSTTPAQFDPAANMLNMLQNKLEDIQASVRSAPRTGYAGKSYGGHAPQLHDTLDDDFVALVTCQPAATSCLGKRKAVSQPEPFDPKAADLKARNRASAKASRERKKAQLQTLHKQIDQLTTQNLELAQTCQDVAAENQQLREELKKLGFEGQDHEDVKKLINRAPVAEVEVHEVAVEVRDIAPTTA